MESQRTIFFNADYNEIKKVAICICKMSRLSFHPPDKNPHKMPKIVSEFCVQVSEKVRLEKQGLDQYRTIVLK